MNREELSAGSEVGTRALSHRTRLFVAFIAASWSVLQLLLPRVLLLPSDFSRCIHLAFGMILVFVLYGPLGGRAATVPGWARVQSAFESLRRLVPSTLCWRIDLFLALAAGLSALYYAFDYENISTRSGNPSNLDVVVGIGLVVLLLEAARRSLGPMLSIVASVFILLSFYSEQLPERFAYKAVSLPTLISKLSLSTEGIYGIPLDVSTSIVFLFVLFGTMLECGGGGRWFTDLAFALVGRFRGGAAKASVLASGLTGLVSGSSIANTVTTGTFTIPLMMRSGYPPVKAGAIEVAASTNGQLMPPVMGAAAFIIAANCNISYTTLIWIAALPAYASYLTLFYITHLEAKKLGIQPMKDDEVPRIKEVFWRGAHFLLPVGLLVYCLVLLRLSPQLAAFYSIVCLAFVILAQCLLREASGRTTALGDVMRAGIDATAAVLRTSLVRAGCRMASIAVAVAAAGIIVGVMTTGLGSRFVEIVGLLAQDNIYLLLLLVAVSSLILGMGLPTTANYIVMSALTVPAIVTLGADIGLQISVIAAHLFCFYFGILADDTPPVGVAAYAASAISRADPIATGVQGFTYDLRTAILPFAFVFNSRLILLGVESFGGLALAIVSCLIALLAFASATQGWLLIRLRAYERVLLGAVVFALLLPYSFVDCGINSVQTLVGGFIIYGLVLGLQWLRSRHFIEER